MANPVTLPITRGFANIGPATIVDDAKCIYAYSDCDGVIVEDGPSGPVLYRMDGQSGIIQLLPSEGDE